MTQEKLKEPWRSTAFHVTSENILGLRIREIHKKMQDGIGEVDSNGKGLEEENKRELLLKIGSSSIVGGLRTYISGEEGKGYWDHIEISPGLLITITDVLYYKPHRMYLPAERMLKIRIICSGLLSIPNEDKEISEGSVLLQYIGGNKETEYFVKPGLPLRMVTIHAKPEVLKNLGVTPEILPTFMKNPMDSKVDDIFILFIDLETRLVRIAREIIESRDLIREELRLTYVRGKAYELFCEALQRSTPLIERQVVGIKFRKNDIRRLHEAKRILASHLDESITVAELSRLVGINRTKLKAGFREYFKETIHGYSMRLRLEEAFRLIEGTELQMAEIGRMVGFKYAANFTQNIKRYYGVRPLELRKRKISRDSVEG
ncbi:MAG: hypothetical protein COB36_10205 [Alphaproteobacteria bacterium]|nr:MAG: hypothetical protein COB36_10205 [Alphaproteobacteria bacterium]